jgi:hypothetical protein
MIRRAITAACVLAASGGVLVGTAPAAAGFEPGLTCTGGSGSVTARRPLFGFPADPRPTTLRVRAELDHCSGSGAIASGTVRVRMRLGDNTCPLVPPQSADGRTRGVIVWRDATGRKVERSRIDAAGSLVYAPESATLAFLWTFDGGQLGGPGFSGATGFVPACLSPGGFAGVNAPPGSVGFLG